MELRQLRYVLAIAEHANMRAAARGLHLAPQSLAQQLGTVEREIGTVLFRRHRTGMALTDVGEVFVAQARLVLDAADRLLDTTRRAAAGRPAKPLRVAVATGLAGLFSDVLRRYLERRPAAEVQLAALRSADQLDALRGGRINAGVAYAPRSPRQLAGLRAYPLRAIRIHALVRTDDPLAQAESVRLAALADRPLLLPSPTEAAALRGHLFAMFDDAGLTPLLGPEIYGHELAIASVAAGRGYTLCVPPTTRIGPDLRFLPIADTTKPLKVVLLTRGDDDSVDTRDLVRVTRELHDAGGLPLWRSGQVPR